MDIDKVEKFVLEAGEKKFRMNQIKKGLFLDLVEDFSEVKGLPKDLQNRLNAEFLQKKTDLLSLEFVKVLKSSNTRSIKAVLKTEDNFLIETVLISPKAGTWSACISSQIGCALGCAFCATGKMGFKRNLSAEEIFDQVLFWARFLKKEKITGSFSNVVYMGMGEPFLNWENVKKSLTWLLMDDGLNFSARKVSVSTAGVFDFLDDFAESFPQVNLAVSLHFADDDNRTKFMPINRKTNLQGLKKYLKKYLKNTKRKVFLEYTLLENINDTEKDLQNLINFVEGFGKDKYLLHVNLIRYNSVSGDEFISSSGNKARFFKEQLWKKRINVSIRKSLGEDIEGACGQLAGKV